jgi:hypothetical protein
MWNEIAELKKLFEFLLEGADNIQTNFVFYCSSFLLDSDRLIVGFEILQHSL